MNSEETRYQYVEDYLKGKLSEEEVRSFEEKISSDKELAQDVAVQRVALESLERAYIQSMSALIRNRVEKNNTRKKYWFGGGVILLACLLIGSSYLIVRSTPVSRNESGGNSKKNEPAHSYNAPDKEDKMHTDTKNPDAESKRVAVPLIDSSSFIKEYTSETFQAQIPTDVPAIPEIKSNKQTVTADSKTENQQSVSRINCPDHAPEISVRITTASYDVQSGSIQISMPDKWDVYLKGANTTYENKTFFADLSAGTYTLYIQNEYSCIFQIGTYTITHSNCSFEKNYVFNKQFDSEWKIPGALNTPYQVSILNKGGMEVFSENVPAYGNTSWNGLNKNGEKAAIGLHKVIVTYPDNKTCIYNVVVSE